MTRPRSRAVFWLVTERPNLQYRLHHGCYGRMRSLLTLSLAILLLGLRGCDELPGVAVYLI